jgi:ornithine--oxo-acid transaminase
LVITEDEVQSALKIISEAMDELPTIKGAKEDAVLPEGERHVHIGVDN